MIGRRPLPHRAVLPLAVFAAALCHGAVARAADSPATAEASGVTLAERRAAEAFDAYNRKDYATAVALYLQAFDASPSGIILFNVARIYDTKLGDRPLAMTFYRRYIADPGADVERIKLANQRLADLRAAEAASSDVTVGAGSGGPPAATARGVSRESASAAPAPAAEGDHGGWSALRWTGVTFGVLGVAGIVVGSVYGLNAASKASTARQTCDGSTCTSQAGVDAAHVASNDATVSTVGFAAGGALLAVGTALFLVGGGKKSPERPPTAVLHWDVSGGPSSLALGVRGTW